MAVVSQLHGPRVVDLRKIRASGLEPVLEEEILSWREQLDWDFRPSADLVRRFVGMQALNGYALAESGALVGYVYFVCEEHKGLVGDLYLLRNHHTVENENRLLGAVLENLMRTPHLHRIESQLMMLLPDEDRPFPGSQFLKIHRRNFMSAGTDAASRLGPRSTGRSVVFEQWADNRQEEAARLIAAAYDGHIDSEINDQYRSAGGARRFLNNIVQYPGCGTFFQSGSFLAVGPAGGRLCGLSLASLIASDVGHITQVCVAPDLKGQRIGYELLRRSLVAMSEFGCRRASLTVTAENTGAVQLYEQMGFETVRTFSAMVWENF